MLRAWGGVVTACPTSEDARGAAADHAAAGEALRDRRRARNLTIEEAAVATRIPLRVLRAIEASDFADPASRPGAIAFAATYARWLGVDETAVTVAVRAALSRVAARNQAPIGTIEQPLHRHIAIDSVATLLIAVLIAGAGWCAWMLL